jgi:hypothetical protein
MPHPCVLNEDRPRRRRDLKLAYPVKQSTMRDPPKQTSAKQNYRTPKSAHLCRFCKLELQENRGNSRVFPTENQNVFKYAIPGMGLPGMAWSLTLTFQSHRHHTRIHAFRHKIHACFWCFKIKWDMTPPFEKPLSTCPCPEDCCDMYTSCVCVCVCVGGGGVGDKETVSAWTA